MNAITQVLAAGGARVYTTETVQSLPAMTDATTPAGHIISASSFYGAASPTYPYQAFKQDGISTRWANNADANPWLQRQTPAPIRVGAYRIQAGYSSQTGSSWSLQGSNDGSNWVTLDTRTGEVWSGDGAVNSYTVPLANRGNYAYHRLQYVSGGGYIGVYELELLQDF